MADVFPRHERSAKKIFTAIICFQIFVHLLCKHLYPDEFHKTFGTWSLKLAYSKTIKIDLAESASKPLI